MRNGVGRVPLAGALVGATGATQPAGGTWGRMGPTSRSAAMRGLDESEARVVLVLGPAGPTYMYMQRGGFLPKEVGLVARLGVFVCFVCVFQSSFCCPNQTILYEYSHMQTPLPLMQGTWATPASTRPTINNPESRITSFCCVGTPGEGCMLGFHLAHFAWLCRFCVLVTPLFWAPSNFNSRQVSSTRGFSTFLLPPRQLSV
jgi:hypothetical protein